MFTKHCNPKDVQKAKLEYSCPSLLETKGMDLTVLVRNINNPIPHAKYPNPINRPFDTVPIEDRLKSLYLRKIIKENHDSPITSICINPTLGKTNMVLTAGGCQLNTYDNENHGDHLDVLNQFNNVSVGTAIQGKSIAHACFLHLAPSFKDTLIACGGEESTIQILSIRWSRVVQLLSGQHKKPIHSIVPSPFYPHLLFTFSASGENLLCLWNAFSGKCLWKTTAAISSIAWDPITPNKCHASLLSIATGPGSGPSIVSFLIEDSIAKDAKVDRDWYHELPNTRITPMTSPDIFYSNELSQEESSQSARGKRNRNESKTSSLYGNLPPWFRSTLTSTSKPTFETLINSSISKRFWHSKNIDQISPYQTKDGYFMLSRDIGGSVVCFNLETKSVHCRFNVSGSNNFSTRHDVSSDGMWYCQGSEDGEIHIYALCSSPSTLISEHECYYHRRCRRSIKVVRFGPYIDCILIGDEGGYIYRWDYMNADFFPDDEDEE